LIRFGERLFAANWTEQDSAGRPASQRSGLPLGDPRLPLTGGRATNRVSGPDANSCRGAITCRSASRAAVAILSRSASTEPIASTSSPLIGAKPSGKPGRAPKQPDSLQAFGLRASPGLFGAGYLEMLARQMTEDLQQVRDGLKPGSTAPLGAKGVTFGVVVRQYSDRRANHVATPRGLNEVSALRRVLRKYYIRSVQRALGRCPSGRQVIKSTRRHTGTMSRRRRSWPSTIRRLLCDVVTLARLALTPRAQLAAENLFLRKQLALYQERGVKPRRLDPATRVILVHALTPAGVAFTPDGGPARHAHTVASSGLAAPLAVDVAARTAADSEGPAATHREHGPGEPDLG
jgi:hypothetical protein